MPTLQQLRQHRVTARRVLAWFVASLLVAGFAPWVQAAKSPLAWSSVCSTSNPAKVATQGTGSTHGWECSQCLPFIAPPPAAQAQATPTALPVALEPAIRLGVIQWRSAAPLDARGPPVPV